MLVLNLSIELVSPLVLAALEHSAGSGRRRSTLSSTLLASGRRGSTLSSQLGQVWWRYVN